MADPKYQSARKVAFQVLSQFDPQRNYAGLILNRLLPETNERQRATDLVFGTIRNRTAVDTVIETFSGKPAQRITKKLLCIIRLATYELVYSPQTPDYSIVNEAVENVKTIAGKKQIAFVNAVLRQIARHITNRTEELAAANVVRTLPQNPTTGCEFDTDFLADPETSPAKYLGTCFSLPEWLVNNWLSEYGTETVRQICLASNRRPSIYIRPNILKIDANLLGERFRKADIDFEIVADPQFSKQPQQAMLRLKSPQAVDELAGFAQGFFSVQDISASQAVYILNPLLRGTILDLCAAPGGKTTQLAETIAGAGRIIATDVDTGRLEKIRENIARLGLINVEIVAYKDLEKGAADVGKFDAILLDVPCSNTGVLTRRIEVRFRITSTKIEKLAKVQTELLNKAAMLVKPGGKICYSTCSIQREENNDRIKDFLASNPTFQLESERLILPSAEHTDHDGGYVAILRSTAQ